MNSVKSLLLIMLLIMVLPSPARSELSSEIENKTNITAKSDTDGFNLKTYEADGYKFEAGFLPDKAEYVWGEPMYYFTFVVKNTGNETLNFREGGDYRGGRSESHKISAVDENGRPVSAPEMPGMGGLVHIMKLEPNEIYTKMMPVSRRLTFSESGSYTVTGQRTLELGKTLEEAEKLKVPTSNSFHLTIHPYSVEQMNKVVDSLAEQIWNAGDIAPKPIEYTEPTEITDENRLHLALSTLTTIKSERALEHLISMAESGKINLRAAALKCLGEFTDQKAMAVILKALDDNEEAIRSAAAEALGILKSDAAIDVLIARLPQAEPQVAAAILRAMGNTKSPRVFKLLAENLKNKNDIFRRAAVNGLVTFGSDDAIQALKSCTNDNDMDFREFVIKNLADSLRQPIDADWLVPVIISRKNTHTIGDAPRLMRLYAGPKAVPALLSCLDYENPSIRSYYNHIIIYSQGWCRGGMRIPWNSDLNRDGTPEETEQNREILRKIKLWVEHYYTHRLDEEILPQHLYWREQEKYWGEAVDGICVRARIDQRVWPEGMPQLIVFDVRGNPNGGSINISNVPELLELEINDQWYARKPALTEATMGIDAGHGSSYHNLLLDDKWLRKSDNQPLKLRPGKYTIRIGLSLRPADERTGPAISKPVTFEVIKTD